MFYAKTFHNQNIKEESQTKEQNWGAALLFIIICQNISFSEKNFHDICKRTFAQNRNIFTSCKKSSFGYYFVKRYIFFSLILSKDIFSKQTSKKNCWHTFMLTASPHHSKHHSDHINPSPTHYHILTSPSPSPTLLIRDQHLQLTTPGSILYHIFISLLPKIEIFVL